MAITHLGRILRKERFVSVYSCQQCLIPGFQVPSCSKVAEMDDGKIILIGNEGDILHCGYSHTLSDGGKRYIFRIQQICRNDCTIISASTVCV